VQYPDVEANPRPGQHPIPPPTAPALAEPLTGGPAEATVAREYSTFLSRPDLFSHSFDSSQSPFVMGLFSLGTAYRSTHGVDPRATERLESQPAGGPTFSFMLKDSAVLALFAVHDQVWVTTSQGCLGPSSFDFGPLLEQSKTYSRVVLTRTDMLLAVVPSDPSGKISIEADSETTTGAVGTAC